MRKIEKKLKLKPHSLYNVKRLKLDFFAGWEIQFAQIKEKFGGLRFYYNGGDEVIDNMVDSAEMTADKTCEMCGKPGEKRGGGWIKTLCDEHDAERKAKYGRMEVPDVGAAPDSKAV